MPGKPVETTSIAQKADLKTVKRFSGTPSYTHRAILMLIIRQRLPKGNLFIEKACDGRPPDAHCALRTEFMTEEAVDEALLKKLSVYCDEFLIHAVDVEGKARGMEQELVKFIGNYTGNPITYAGGVHSMEDLYLLKKLGQNRMNVTIGSALDLFGGSMKWEDVLTVCREK